MKHLAQLADGDARVALNALEMTVDSVLGKVNREAPLPIEVTQEMMRESFQRSTLLYDKDGEEHYNLISALHKSLRGSDADASIYWLGRMLYAGEDPLYIARRLIRFASEDVGLADNTALPLALATFQSCQVVGMPECDVILAHCATYLARCAKGVEVYKAMKRVKQTVEKEGGLPVPLHIRNAPTKLMKELNYGAGYKYNPDYEGTVEQDYLPEQLKMRKFFNEGLVDDCKVADGDAS
ncbi:Werner helicase interacting protein 1 [Rhizophlyctis rosea]|uniref:Werner helicase interacting protein 1 n=1 Tax=Rhizophlyctis rosea TaxID=64517 RepID=A0AAD5X028_9FUNG|nr:Werner helicase interacting protein 1 [Rhizophlyctis rosea]